MDAITNLMQNLEISKDFFGGKDLATEKDFLQKVELSFKEQNFKQKIEFATITHFLLIQEKLRFTNVTKNLKYFNKGVHKLFFFFAK